MSFTAKYRGECAECGDRIEPGESVEFSDIDGEIQHAVRCTPADLQRRRPLCDRCYVELPKSGLCDECDDA